MSSQPNRDQVAGDRTTNEVRGQDMSTAVRNTGGAVSSMIENRWVDAEAQDLSPEQLLLYRSNLLGADKRVTNFGGGNTSAKIPMKDPLTGQPVQVLWVKGSGGDIGTMKLDGFATLYMDKLLALRARYHGPQDED